MNNLEKLKQLTAWDAEPALTEDDLDELLVSASLEDANGLAPINEEWTPTYDLNAAAVAGWLIKAGRAAATIDTPESGPITSKIFDNCRTMAGIYAAKRKATITLNR
ncbi:MAG: hypothetical protein QM785_03295 [Pyrinomonadaceae bacterium]